MLTAATAHALLEYTPTTGTFRWRVNTNNIKAGELAGTDNGVGYVRIQCKSKLYYAHRLAWLMFYGCWPASQLDHIDGNTSNNRITNLREATRSENAQNKGRSVRNISGYTGVHWDADRSKWGASIRVDRKTLALGRFCTIQEAAAAYASAKARLHVFHALPVSRLSPTAEAEA